ncbi:MAG: VWA domain-containing protein, partial [Bacteroidales bacterium]
PPKKGRSHLLHIIREMLEYEPLSRQTNISEALRFLTNAIKKRCTAFLLSDMMDLDSMQKPRFEEALKIAVNKHDLAAIQVFDPRETSLPDVGLVRMADAETGCEQWIDTSGKKVRDNYARWYQSSQDNLKTVLNKYHVDYVKIATDQDYVQPLIRLFKSRA